MSDKPHLSLKLLAVLLLFIVGLFAVRVDSEDKPLAVCNAERWCVIHQDYLETMIALIKKFHGKGCV